MWKAESKSSLMTREASGEACFKPVYCSEMCPHTGNVLQCSAATFIHQVGSTTVGRHQLCPPERAVGPTSPVPVPRDTRHRLARAASTSVLPEPPAAGSRHPSRPRDRTCPSMVSRSCSQHCHSRGLTPAKPLLCWVLIRSDCGSRRITCLSPASPAIARCPNNARARSEAVGQHTPAPASRHQSAIMASQAGTTSSSLSGSQ